MWSPVKWVFAVIAGCSFCNAQTCQQPVEITPAAANLAFTDGAFGTPPQAWHLGPDWFMPPSRGHMR